MSSACATNPGEFELTLKELAQIALGAPDITKLNMTVLHALINILLKKFNCTEEKVTLPGFEARCLKTILAESKICPLAFNDEKLTAVAKRVEQLDDIVLRVGEIERQLNQHFEQIRECNKIDFLEKAFSLSNFEPYANKCEDMCTLCENEVACSLLSNCDFLRKLLRRMSAPIVNRIFEFETKIEKLNIELNSFLQRAEEQFEKIKLIEGCVIELERLRARHREHELKFLGTMEEVQDMMDAKLDKMHMPPLKKYIQDYMARLEDRLLLLETQKTCGKAAGILMDLRCLSCGADPVCAERGVHKTAMLPDMKPPHSTRFQDNPPLERFCACRGIGQGITLTERMMSLNLKTVENQLLNKRRRSCRGAQFNEIVGTNGSIYRGDP